MSWLAVDGEAEAGKYALMCDSDHRSIYKSGGLNTKEIFEFLLGSRLKVIACFGLNYDANNWLVDLPGYRLKELWETNKCTYVVGATRYRIEWIPGKWFRVGKGAGPSKKSVQICEVWGYFQSSFVKACEMWNLPVQKELEVMKSKRGTFTKRELPRVKAYCMSECDLLSQLMEKVREQCARLEIEPERWIGAGSLASALMKKHDVKSHLKHDAELAEGDGLQAILKAYFGGRVEMYRQGDFKDVYSYDINSAYPAGAQHLPNLNGARIEHWKRYTAAPYAVWRVSWDCKTGTMVPPFPARVKKQIYYPLKGEGCYHAAEVRAAINAGYPVTVHEGWVLTPDPEAPKPFAWIPDVYAERDALKKQKDHGEKVLKLALNSVYGKLAQGKGYRDRNPVFQSYFWAGQITASCRARMLDLAARQTPLMISTDGIFFDAPLKDVEPDSSELGGLSHGHMDEFWIGLPGVYWGQEGGVEVVRSRGFFARDIDYKELREGYAEQGPEYVHAYKSERFIGLGVALQRNDPAQWRSWRPEIRHINLRPTRRDVDLSTESMQGSLLPLPGPMSSEPYTPKGSKKEPGLGPSINDLQGLDQPLKTG